MELVRGIAEVRQRVGAARGGGGRIALVPTMGFLHEGHLSLLDRAREVADYSVMSVFVNPLQFGPTEDFHRYPRDLERDLRLASERGVDLVFAPDEEELYPRRLTVAVTPKRLADRLCGMSRPGHFEGVLTVVAKLFGIVQPDVGVFGQKDFQQWVLIRRMVQDLDYPVEIEVSPTVREADGLAMSSRNQYLDDEERGRALRISRSLAEAVRQFRAGRRDAERLKLEIRARLEAGGGLDVEYVDIVTADGLESVVTVGNDAVVAVAARVGSTRLIDNVILARPDPDLERLL